MNKNELIKDIIMLTISLPIIILELRLILIKKHRFKDMKNTDKWLLIIFVIAFVIHFIDIFLLIFGVE